MKIIIVILIIICILILKEYNTLIKSRNAVKQAKSGIDIYLNQRFDLIPNLVECVKGYAKHEKELLETVTGLRATYFNNSGNNIKVAENLNNSMNKLIGVAENYPELKASDQFLNLQKNLSKLESQLQAARRIYNNEVTDYNTRITTVPTNILAKIFNFQEAELFTIEEDKRENTKINIEG